jgi:hypothetical protein
LGERQKLSVKIESRSIASTGGILLLESQTEGMVISQTEKVHALINQDEKEQQEIELDILETGEITLPDLAKNSILELFVTYEGPYTEFDYRVKYYYCLRESIIINHTLNRSKQPSHIKSMTKIINLFLLILLKLQFLYSLQNQLYLEKLGKYSLLI